MGHMKRGSPEYRRATLAMLAFGLALPLARDADQLIALRRQNTDAQAAQPVASGVDLANVNFRYAIEGDRAPWRPLRAFDDGRQVPAEGMLPSASDADDREEESA